MVQFCKIHFCLRLLVESVQVLTHTSIRDVCHSPHLLTTERLKGTFLGLSEEGEEAEAEGQKTKQKSRKKMKNLPQRIPREYFCCFNFFDSPALGISKRCNNLFQVEQACFLHLILFAHSDEPFKYFPTCQSLCFRQTHMSCLGLGGLLPTNGPSSGQLLTHGDSERATKGL